MSDGVGDGPGDGPGPRVDELFAAALGKPPAERGRYLEQACGADAALRAELESLLAHHDASGAFLDEPVVEHEFAEALSPRQGDTIGPYRIVEPVGEGGFGIVYLAEQEAPLSRRVALKVLKPGMDSRRVLGRFRVEQETLARMDHPHVARVFDAGATPEGRPYFVMEHVPGLPLTEHCDRHRLTLEARLRLFVHVCEAVQHAHQKGVIHRDLKPSNILVSCGEGPPAPKVIDFGVARALDHRPSAASVFTEAGQLVGTPAYMSPEQFGPDAAHLDTRSDIYALGVLLYELLTGATPFGPDTLERASFVEIQRIVRETEPPRPSTRVAAGGGAAETAARARGLEGKGLRRALRGDLDWIVMRALEKDRERRYGTASDLAADIRRHLASRPVFARPPSRAYRLARLARRHRAGVVAAALVALSGLVGIAATTWQAIRATAAEARAVDEAKIARAVNEFLNEDLLAAVDPANTPDRQITVREALDAASARVEGRFPDEPLVEASIRHTIGRTYVNLGELDAAEPHLREALRIQGDHLGEANATTLATSDSLATLYFLAARFEACVDLLVRSLEFRRRDPGEAHLDTLTNIGNLARTYNLMGRTDEAEALARRDYEISRRELGPEHLHTLSAATELGRVCVMRGDFDEAETLVAGILDSRRRQLGPDHPDTLAAMNNLATVYRQQGRLEAAVPVYEQTLDGCRRVFGAAHPHTLLTAGNLGEIRLRLGHLDEAEALLDEAIATGRSTLGAGHPDVAMNLGRLASVLRGQGRLDAAAEVAEEAIEGLRVSPPGRRVLIEALAVRGVCLMAVGHEGEAELALAEALELMDEGGGPEALRAEVEGRLASLRAAK